MNYPARGIRNNNPFNIVQSKHPWIGKLSHSTDPKFEQFSDIDYGVRAGLKLLITYVDRGFDTIDKIIKRYCPDSTASNYILYIVKNFSFRTPITRSDKITKLSTLLRIAYMMVKLECNLNDAQMAGLGLTTDRFETICHKYNLLTKTHLRYEKRN